MIRKIITEQNVKLVTKLADEYRRNRLVLFLGAGISKSCQLPDWPEIRKAVLGEYFDANFANWRKPEDPSAEWLISYYIEKMLNKSSAPVTGRYMKYKLGDRYLEVLRRALYGRPFKISPTLQAVSHMNNLNAICTYNYDDLLETATKKSGSFTALTCPNDQAKRGTVPVYHVHGLLPHDPTDIPKGDIVFAEDEYHLVFRDAFHWSNTIQLSLFRECTCLLIGTSLTDPNLRRLLDVVDAEKLPVSRIAVMRFKPDPNDEHGMLSEVIKQFNEESMAHIGVSILWIHDYDKAIPAILQSIISDDPPREYIRAVFRNNQPRTTETNPLNLCTYDNCDQPSLYNHRYCALHEKRIRIIENIGEDFARKYLEEDDLKSLD